MKRIVEETKYVVVTNDTSGFIFYLCDTEDEAKDYLGFGDFCGYAEIDLAYPKEVDK